ncbi:hypothetical protein GCM10009619_05660 [Williamsia maris]
MSDFLLTASDVPVGYTQMSVPPAQAAAAAQSILSSSKDSKVTPTSCQPDLSGASADSLAKSATAIFSNQSAGDLIVSVAVPDTKYVDNYRTFNLGSCAKHQVAGEINGQAFTGSITAKQLDVPTPGISGALVIQQDVASKLAGGPESPAQSSLIALLPVKGTTVLVSQKSILGTKVPSQTEFATVVAAAAKRAANG